MVENNKNVCLDSNIIIYSGNHNYAQLRYWLRSRITFVSTISQVEVLGYYQLTPKDEIYFNTFFSNCRILEIGKNEIEKAIHLRQQKAMSLGDSLIAACALCANLPLLTVNKKDYKHLNSLELIDFSDFL